MGYYLETYAANNNFSGDYSLSLRIMDNVAQSVCVSQPVESASSEDEIQQFNQS